MGKRRSLWTRAGLTFALTILAASVLLPLARVQPESAHKFLNGLNDWIRIGFTFALSVILTGAIFKLLSPHIGHLAHLRNGPPAWLAAIAAWLVVAAIDLFGGFDTDGYRSTICEWLIYGGGAVFVVSWYFGLGSEINQWRQRMKEVPTAASEPVAFQDVDQVRWKEIETWLQSDVPAEYDFIGNQFVAHRVGLLITDGTRSIGIVGPFGVGKTSIVSWVADRLKRRQIEDRRFFVCHHSCWGFETSASAIHDMLASAVVKVGKEIDTFDVDSLPKSYRDMFSAGGDWIDTVSKLVLRTADPMEQFSRLSDLLGTISGRLVFIVEDLDRNETRNFEIQEVLAFLERIKTYLNISFVLTGGLLSSQRIDYAKLCDHIEYLRAIQPQHSSCLIERVRQRCLDDAVFPHLRLGDASRNYEWNPFSNALMRDYEELSFAEAVSSLLNTPRALRHALGRTFSAWHVLCGEIDLDHLLAINVLRFGAPECFQFLLRRWERLRSPPNQSSAFGPERTQAIRQAILNDWNRTIQNVEWNPTAAVQVMEFILPATEYWLVDSSRYGRAQTNRQSVSEERYWIRAINESIDSNEVRDQDVLRDISGWLDDPVVTSNLVTKLTSSPQYCIVWEDLAGNYLAGRIDEILLLCEQVISRLLSDQGSSAWHNSQGFASTWQFARRRVSHQPQTRTWLQDRISDAASVSLEMVNGLWHYYGGRNGILRPEDVDPVRQHLLDAVRTNVTDGPTLVARLSPKSSATVFQLVLDSGNEGAGNLAEPQAWAWLEPHLFDALRSGSIVAAVNCSVLLGGRVSGREQMRVDSEVLDQFFGDDASEVIDILESMIGQLPEADRPLIRNITAAAHQHFAGGAVPEEQENETDAD